MNVADALRAARDDFDLTEQAHLQSLRDLADGLLDDPNVTLDDLKAAAQAPRAPLELRLAAKLYESRRAMLAIERPTHIGVLFAMWGEHVRLRPKTSTNPHGENALRVKLEQLDWVCRHTPVTWSLYAVDDGDPEDSGALAREIADSHRLGGHVHSLWLRDAVPADSGPLAKLQDVDASRKGGAIVYGAKAAVEDGCEAVVYTDADNSVHLGQLGLLVAPFREGHRVVLGNRKHPESVLVKAGDRWGPGIKVLRHMQRMVGHAIFSRGIADTQAAFKLYESTLLREIIADPTVFDFSFDTDWIAAAIAQGESLHQVPFAFIDSAAESASAKQNPMTTWECLLLGLLRAMRRHDLLVTPESRAMAALLDRQVRDYHDLELVIDHVPKELAGADEAELGNARIMEPAALERWIEKLRETSLAARVG